MDRRGERILRENELSLFSFELRLHTTQVAENWWDIERGETKLSRDENCYSRSIRGVFNGLKIWDFDGLISL